VLPVPLVSLALPGVPPLPVLLLNVPERDVSVLDDWSFALLLFLVPSLPLPVALAVLPVLLAPAPVVLPEPRVSLALAAPALPPAP
jgi:hypothetical protein